MARGMTGAFEALELGDPRWTPTVVLGRADLFYSANYCRFRYGGQQDRPTMFRYEDAFGVVFDVSVVRQVAQLPFLAHVTDKFARPPVDLVSPEYNGPVVVGAAQDRFELLRRYRRSVSEYCCESGVVTEFVRVHPFSDCGADLAGIEATNQAADIVYIDLSQGYEQARTRYRKDRRKRISTLVTKGMRANFVDPTPERVDRLSEFYSSNMEKADAKSSYVHGADFFNSMYGLLADTALMVEVIDENGVLCVYPLLLEKSRIWFFYGATDPSRRGTGADDVAYDFVFRWGADEGFEVAVLGGRFSSGDGLYEYKRGFSKLSAPVRHLRRVHDPATLAKLIAVKADFDARQQRRTRTDYFPSYWLD